MRLRHLIQDLQSIKSSLSDMDSEIDSSERPNSEQLGRAHGTIRHARAEAEHLLGKLDANRCEFCLCDENGELWPLSGDEGQICSACLDESDHLFRCAGCGEVYGTDELHRGASEIDHRDYCWGCS